MNPAPDPDTKVAAPEKPVSDEEQLAARPCAGTPARVLALVDCLFADIFDGHLGGFIVCCFNRLDEWRCPLSVLQLVRDDPVPVPVGKNN